MMCQGRDGVGIGDGVYSEGNRTRTATAVRWIYRFMGFVFVFVLCFNLFAMSDNKGCECDFACTIQRTLLRISFVSF